jgi:hypothetical protein
MIDEEAKVRAMRAAPLEHRDVTDIASDQDITKGTAADTVKKNGLIPQNPMRWKMRNRLAPNMPKHWRHKTKMQTNPRSRSPSTA